MFFSNHKPTAAEDRDMFNLERIGANIMKARKAKGLTQMALADELGISFQAVSNWERGQSAPDIAKLVELSRLLDVSIDELLGNERAARITKEIAGEKAPTLAPEELEQVAPLLTEAQADKAADAAAPDFATLAGLAPFLSEEFLGEAVLTLYERTGSLEGAMSLVPFLDEGAVSELAAQIVPREGAPGLTKLAPFMDEDELGDIVLELVQKGGVKDIKPFLPFLCEEVLNELAWELFKQGGVKAITPLAPFIDEDTLDDIARAVLKTGDLSQLSSLLPFLKGDLGDC